MIRAMQAIILRPLRLLPTVLGSAALLLLTLAGCGPHPSPTENSAPVQTTSGASGHKAAANAQVVTLTTADGWRIVGDLYAPKGKSHGAIVLLHQRGGSASDWQPLCTALQKAGFTAVAIDQRGNGRSLQGPFAGEEASWDTTNDIDAVVRSSQDKGPIGLVGASYGANNALIYAARAGPKAIRGVALFSPGAVYNDLDAIAPARAYRGAVVIYHDKDDSIAGTGPQQIDQVSVSPDHRLHLYAGSQHGTALLNPETIADVVAFFQKVLKGP